MFSVSVVIPAYNCQNYIRQAIASALDQCVSEVIVVDDGSVDDTQAIVKQFDDDRLIYIFQQNQGVSAARNCGVKSASSQLVAFLDADDYYWPHKIEQQAALFDANPSLGLVQSGWQRVDETGNPIADVTRWQSVPQLTVENWLRYKPVLPSALMVRRDWLLKVGGFDSQFKAAEDVDLVSRLALQGCQCAWLEQVAVSYRQRKNSAMGDGRVQAQDLSKFLNKFFQQSALPESVRLVEQSVRYHTLVWASWYLQHTGELSEMAHYLKQAWQHSPYLPVEALMHWADSFSSFSQDWGAPLDMEPLIQSAQWQQLVQWLLNQPPQMSRVEQTSVPV